MRVLVACEFSGIVREAFRVRGHDAWSCDILPSEIPGQHIQDDVFNHLSEDWDLMISFWPCTLLCNSGVRWLYKRGKGGERWGNRWTAMEKSAARFYALLTCGTPKVCAENPRPHRYAKALMGDYTQVIHPWQFGHGETKATCLWLRGGLPLLVPTNIVDGRSPRVHHESPGPDRWKNRSRTLPGIAAAMAEQWGGTAI